MLIIITICALAIIVAYEIRHRMIAEQLAYFDNETHKLNQEIKIIQEEIKGLKEGLAKKQDAEIKKGFKFPFLR